MNIGFIYKLFIDPILAPLHKAASKYIKPDSKIIDIACGTGSFVFHLAPNANFVTGVDLSESMLKAAIKMQKRHKVNNVSFHVKDASNLDEYSNKTFDYATISMALHQFPPDLGIKIMFELQRIAREIVIIDYAFPLPKNRYKMITYIIERIAGKEHFNNFKKYQAYRGLTAIAEKTGVRVTNSKIRGNGIFVIAKCTE